MKDLKKKRVFILFDKIPRKEDGGLVATYAEFVREFKDIYDISFISIFKSPAINIDEFVDIPVITIVDKSIDNRFYRLLSYLKSKNFKAFLKAFKSVFVFFGSIPYARAKIKDHISNVDYIIAPAPASAIFISNRIRFILEVHINYEYFWGRNFLGRMQVALMAKPAITVFRNSVDAKKGSEKFPSTYIYNCFNDSNLEQAKLELRKKHSAVFVGRLEEQKQPFKLLDYSMEVKQVITDFTLDIYGEGALRSQLEDQIIARDLQDTVFLKGFTKDKSVYKNYDITWLTSAYEGFGLVIIEAMANGVPTVSVEWGDAVWEIIKNGSTGIVAKTDNDFVEASIRLLEDKDYRGLLAANAKKDYEMRFSPEKHKASWEKLFHEVYE